MIQYSRSPVICPALLGVGETDIFYSKPDAIPPELPLPVELSYFEAKLFEQPADGYCLSLSRFPQKIDHKSDKSGELRLHPASNCDVDTDWLEGAIT